MDNQIVWGLPHVFAVFLIVAASGALNVASLASVFQRVEYKPLAPLSAWLAIALLAGGLAVLALDLGRPERLVVAMTRYNFSSIFAWNMFLYSGFFALAGLYLFAMMERKARPHAGAAGTAAFVWRLVLTTGTGSIFGFLVARDAYASALLAPTFIALSLVYGTASFLICLSFFSGASFREEERRLARLLGWFIVAALFFIAVFHLTNLYAARQIAVERFLLVDGGLYPLLFWGGQVLAGSFLPLLLIAKGRFLSASYLVILGGLAQMYVTIVGAQAWPMELVPGFDARSSFHDGEIHAYLPDLHDVSLALAGVAFAAAIVAAGVKLLRLAPAKA
jgi:molybdopterin-containing oxidoreductase family membrane subunit